MLRFEQRDGTRGIIIGTPLVLIAIFCFGLAMVNPADKTEAKATSGVSNVSNTHKSAATSASKVNYIKPLPPVSAPADSNSVGYSTASPQPTSQPANNVTLQQKNNPRTAPSNSASPKSDIPVTSSSSDSYRNPLKSIINNSIRPLTGF